MTWNGNYEKDVLADLCVKAFGDRCFEERRTRRRVRRKAAAGFLDKWSPFGHREKRGEKTDDVDCICTRRMKEVANEMSKPMYNMIVPCHSSPFAASDDLDGKKIFSPFQILPWRKADASNPKKIWKDSWCNLRVLFVFLGFGLYSSLRACD